MFYKIKGISPRSGKGTVAVVYRQPGFETMKSTGVTVRPEDFDTKTGRVKARVPEHPELNAQIQGVVSDLELAVRNVRQAHGALTKDLLDEAYNALAQATQELRRSTAELVNWYPEHVVAARAKLDKKEAKLERKRRELATSTTFMVAQGAQIPSTTTDTLVNRIAAFVKVNPEHVRPKTLDGYEDTLDTLRAFSPETGLADVNLRFFQDYQSYLVGKGMRNGSVRTYLDRLKKLYRTLADDENLPYGFLKRFKVVEELADENVITLTEDEIVALEGLPLRSLRQRQVRAQFLFSCEVGLRHSDLYITRENVLDDTLRVVTRKGKRTVKPPLSPRARAILASEYFPFTRIAINQYNNTIQAICRKLPSFQVRQVFTHFVGNNPVTEECARWQAMTSHVGRKTAINRWLSGGTRESVVARWVGHKDTKMIEKHYQDYEAATAQEVLKSK